MPENEYEFEVIYTTSDKIPDIEHKWGQLIFCKDTKEIYTDDREERKLYQQIVILENEAARQSLIPVTAFYFVRNTNVIWRYDGGWIQLTSPPREYMFFGAYEDFPLVGAEDVLYIDDTQMYRFLNGSYQLMNPSASSPIWQE